MIAAVSAGCPRCGAMLTLEPARQRCVACGRQYDRPGAGAIDRERQRALDRAYQRPGEPQAVLDGLLIGLEAIVARRGRTRAASIHLRG